jgi:hypothetical protein
LDCKTFTCNSGIIEPDKEVRNAKDKNLSTFDDVRVGAKVKEIWFFA